MFGYKMSVMNCLLQNVRYKMLGYKISVASCWLRNVCDKMSKLRLVCQPVHEGYYPRKKGNRFANNMLNTALSKIR